MRQVLKRRKLFSLILLLAFTCFTSCQGGGGFSKLIDRVVDKIKDTLEKPQPAPAAQVIQPPFCVQQVPGLANILQHNEELQKLAIAVKDSLKPFLASFRDKTTTELNDAFHADPKIFENAFPRDFGQKINAFAQQLSSFKNELEDAWRTTPSPRCYPVINKDLHTLAALTFQELLYERALLVTTDVRDSSQYAKGLFPVADHVPFTILKGAIDGKCQPPPKGTKKISQGSELFPRVAGSESPVVEDILRDDSAKKGLSDLANYLAIAGIDDFRIFEWASYDSAEMVFKKIDKYNFSNVKPDIMLDLAPVFLLIYDVGVVGRNLKSLSTKFLHDHNELLKEGLRRNGNSWRCGEINVWDRWIGRLTSFPTSGPVTCTQNCTVADAVALANTFGSLAAVNYGDCGEANLIQAGPRKVGDQSMYPNLCHLCKEQTTTGYPGGGPTLYGPGGIAPGGPTEVSDPAASPLGRMFGGDSSLITEARDIQSKICPQLGGAYPNGSGSADSGPKSDCKPIPSEKPQRYCGIEVVGDSRVEPEFGAPVGKNCGLRGPFVGPRPAPTPAQISALFREFYGAAGKYGAGEAAYGVEASEAVTEPAIEAIKGAAPKGGRLSSLIAGAATWVGRLIGIACFFFTPSADPSKSSAPPPIATNTTTSSTDSSSGELASNDRPDKKSGGGGGEMGAGDSGADTGAAPPDTFVVDSANPLAGDCTAFGEAVKKLNECQEEWIGEVLEGAGMGTKGKRSIKSGELYPPRDWYAHPVEIVAPSSSFEVGDGCVPSESPGLSGSVTGCEMKLCANPDNPLASSPTQGNCCGLNVADVNLAEQCPICDGVPAIGPDKKCLPECPIRSREPSPPPPGPLPGPTDEGITPLPRPGPGGPIPIPSPK